MRYMNAAEDYLQKLLSQIDRKKAENKKSLFIMNAKISPSTAKYSQDYFDADLSYDATFRFCKSCKGTYDIMIFFL